MRYLSITLLGVLVLVTSQALEAQQIPSPYRYIEQTQSLGGYAGYLWMDKTTPDLGPKSAPVVGLTYTIRFSGPASGVASLGFIPSERTVFTNAAAAGDTTVLLREEGVVSAPLLLAEAGIRFLLTGARTWNGLAPYLIATGGLVADLGGNGDIEVEEDEEFDFGPGFAVGAGAGAEWFVSERFSLRAEVRDQIWRISIPGGLLGTGAEDSRWTNNLGLSVGVALHF